MPLMKPLKIGMNNEWHYYAPWKRKRLPFFYHTPRPAHRHAHGLFYFESALILPPNVRAARIS